MSLHADSQLFPLDDVELTSLAEAEELRHKAMLAGDVETLTTLRRE